MYTVIIYLVMQSRPDVVMITKSEAYPTIEQCVKESMRILQFREKGVTIDGMKVKDAICVKNKE